MSELLARLQELDLEQIKELLQQRNVQCGIVAGVVGIYVLHKLLFKKRYNLPPGPWHLPLLGNLMSMKTMEETNTCFKKWRKQYGNVFTIYLGPSPCVVLASQDVVREAFITKGHDFDGRMEMSSMDLFSDGGKDIAFSQPGPIWKMQRMIAHASIRKYAAGDILMNNLHSAMDSFVSGVNKHTDKVIDVPEEMMKLLYNFLSTMCFGKQFEYGDPWLENFIKSFEDLNDETGAGFISDFIPALKFLDRKGLKALEELMSKFNDMLGKEYAEHRENFDPNYPRDLIDEILLQMHKQKENPDSNSVLSQLSDSHLNMILVDVFFAGTDTSRITLSIMIGLVMENPGVQEKIHKELDDVLGDSGQVTMKIKELIPYTNAVIHEAMRLEPVTPIGVPHKTTRDTTLGPYSIPKDTSIISYQYGIMNDPDNFKNPEKFNPERWINSNGKFQSNPFNFIPFSMGSRVCVGESLAKVDLLMFTAMLFHKYEFQHIGNEPFKLKIKPIQLAVDTETFHLKLIERH